MPSKPRRSITFSHSASCLSTSKVDELIFSLISSCGEEVTALMSGTSPAFSSSKTSASRSLFIPRSNLSIW